MLTRLLNRIAQPIRPRDHRAVAIVARGMQGLLLLFAGSLIAGVYGATVWDLRPCRVLVEVAAATIVMRLIHAGSAVRRLLREMRFRSICRGKGLALPFHRLDQALGWAG